jgi:hypothetical protein
VPISAAKADRDEVGNIKVGPEAPHGDGGLEGQDQADENAQQQRQRQRPHPRLVGDMQHLPTTEHAPERRQPEDCQHRFAEEGDAIRRGQGSPTLECGPVRHGRRPWSGRRRDGEARAGEDRRHPLGGAVDPGLAAMGSLGSQQQGRAGGVAGVHGAQIQHQGLAVCRTGSLNGGRPARSGDGDVESSRERHHPLRRRADVLRCGGRFVRHHGMGGYAGTYPDRLMAAPQ